MIADISAYYGTIYQKDGEETYTVVSVGDLVSSGTTYYYKDNNDEYQTIDDISTYKTVYTKNPVSYTYTAVADAKTLNTDGTYYQKDGDNYTLISDISNHIGIYTQVSNYNQIHFYKKVHHAGVAGASPSGKDLYMFAGLNGKYTTAQESDMNATWEANVHQEERNSKTYWVPYKGENDGWRAEVINVNVTGGKLFKSGMTYPPTENATITGYVRNCKDTDGATAVDNYTPAIPVY